MLIDYSDRTLIAAFAIMENGDLDSIRKKIIQTNLIILGFY